MKKQKTSVNVTISQKMRQQSQEKAIAASDQKNQRQEKADKPVLRHRFFEEDEEAERYKGKSMWEIVHEAGKKGLLGSMMKVLR